jgi:hypothetical protein
VRTSMTAASTSTMPKIRTRARFIGISSGCGSGGSAQGSPRISAMRLSMARDR